MGILKDKYGKLKLLVTSSDSTGCGGYRTYFPYQFLKPNFDWIEHSFGFPGSNPIIMESDVTFVQRANHDFFRTWIPQVQSMGKKVVYDLDDTLWDIPASNLAHRHYPRKELDKVDAVIKLCDCMTTSTVPLKEFLENRFGKKVFLLPNHVWHNEMPVKQKNEKIKIGWAGSYTHAGDFDNYLVKALKSLPQDKVEFTCVGYMPQFFKSFAKHAEWIDFKEYHSKFIEMNWDIGVIVATNNQFNRCKSNIKYLEYSQARCASIADNVYPYINTIDDGIDGFLVKNPKKDWKEYLHRLVEDEQFRLDMANNAYEKVKNKFTFEYDSDTLEQTYTDIFDYLYEGKE